MVGRKDDRREAAQGIATTLVCRAKMCTSQATRNKVPQETSCPFHSLVKSNAPKSLTLNKKTQSPLIQIPFHNPSHPSTRHGTWNVPPEIPKSHGGGWDTLTDLPRRSRVRVYGSEGDNHGRGLPWSRMFVFLFLRFGLFGPNVTLFDVASAVCLDVFA